MQLITQIQKVNEKLLGIKREGILWC